MTESPVSHPARDLTIDTTTGSSARQAVTQVN